MDSHAARVATQVRVGTTDATSTRDAASAGASAVARAGINEESIAFTTLLIGIHSRVGNIGRGSLRSVTGFYWEIGSACAAVAVAFDQMWRGQRRAGTGA